MGNIYWREGSNRSGDSSLDAVLRERERERKARSRVKNVGWPTERIHRFHYVMGTRVACGIVNEIEEIVIQGGRYSNRCYLRCTRPSLFATTIKSKLIIEKSSARGYISSIEEEDHRRWETRILLRGFFPSRAKENLK